MTIGEATKKANEITDSLGMPIDNGIKQTVIALWVKGLETSGSCEGHIDYGLPFPWVDVETEEPDGWEDDEALQTIWKAANDKQAAVLKPLLDKFNRSQDVPLILQPRGIYGAVRLQPTVDEEKSAPELLPQLQTLMKEFGDFVMTDERSI